MELNVTVRGETLREIGEGLGDVLGLVERGFTELTAFDDPEGRLEFRVSGLPGDDDDRAQPTRHP